VELQIFSDLDLGDKGLERDGAIMERSPLRNRRRYPASGAIERRQQNLRSVPAW
jgi:hypothetical protein